MAYEFKKISEVEVLDVTPENATVLGVSDGNVIQMPQPNEIQKLTNVEIFDTVPENATVLGVNNGQIVQMPSSGLGNQQGDSDNIQTLQIIYNTNEEWCESNMTATAVWDAIAERRLGGIVILHDNDTQMKPIEVSKLTINNDSMVLQINDGTISWFETSGDSSDWDIVWAGGE